MTSPQYEQTAVRYIGMPPRRTVILWLTPQCGHLYVDGMQPYHRWFWLSSQSSNPVPCRIVPTLESWSPSDDAGNHTQGHHHSSGRRAAGTVLRRHGIFPDAHQGASRREPRLARADLHRSGEREGGAVRAELRDKDRAPQHPHELLRRQSQAAAAPAGPAEDEQR